MEQTNDIDALMEKIQAQETAYEFDRIDEDLALQMGIYVIRRAREMGKPIATRITLNRRTLFAYSMPGTKPESDNWIRRKENLVYATNGSSYYWECWCEKGDHPFRVAWHELCRLCAGRWQLPAAHQGRWCGSVRSRSRAWRAMRITHSRSRRPKRRQRTRSMSTSLLCSRLRETAECCEH